LRPSLESLKPRGREVFDRVAAGRLNKQIADELGIAEWTVTMQRAQVMEKLGAGSAVELGQLAERLRQLAD
jgi:FixJ family two-component response regulator